MWHDMILTWYDMHPFLPNVCSKANDTHTHTFTHTHTYIYIYTLCTVYMYMRHSAWPHHWTFQRSNPLTAQLLSCKLCQCQLCQVCAWWGVGWTSERNGTSRPEGTVFPSCMEENLVAMWHDRDSHCCPCSATKLKGVNQLLQPQLIVVFALVVAGFWILMTLHVISLWILWSFWPKTPLTMPLTELHARLRHGVRPPFPWKRRQVDQSHWRSGTWYVLVKGILYTPMCYSMFMYVLHKSYCMCSLGYVYACLNYVPPHMCTHRHTRKHTHRYYTHTIIIDCMSLMCVLKLIQFRS